MLTIRLQRTGTKNKPEFRIVLAQSYRSASKKSLEILGHYNPRTKNFGIKDPQRLNHWLAQHVSVSPTVHNLLIEKKIIQGKKVKAWAPKKKEAEASTEAKAPAAAAPEPPAAKAEAAVNEDVKEVKPEASAPAPEPPAA
jgi:small subunit ribosomal protein S16